MSEGSADSPKQNGYLEDLSLLSESARKSTQESKKILSLDADPEEVSEWYYAQDPLNKALFYEIMSSRNSPFKNQIDEIMKTQQERSTCYLTGAALIMAGIFDPDFIDKWRASSNNRIEGMNNQISPIEVIKHSLNLAHRYQEELSLDDLEYLSVAGSMLSHFAATAFFKEDFDQFPKTARDFIAAQGTILYPKQVEIDSLTLGYSIWSEVLSLSHLSKDPEKRMVGIEALWKSNCSLFSEYGSLLLTRPSLKLKDMEKLQQDRERFALEMIDELESMFLREDGLFYNENVKQSFLQGKLHELIWGLDFMILSEITKDGHFIRPASPYENRPRDVKTKYKRGFDYLVANGDTTYNVQLKSNSATKQKGKYDNLIEIQKEQPEDFRDMDPSWLWAKLNCYRQLVACGFNEELVPEVKKYILPTVFKAKEEVNKKGNVHYSTEVANQFGKKPLAVRGDTILPNRQQRRAMEKQKRKK